MGSIVTLFDLLLVYPITNILVVLARVFGGNYGIAIIIFTLLTKVVTWPLTASQYKQSRAMQAMQPKLQELQKKYKGKDPKKLQAETMALYREHGVNPLGCVLPMVVQMPIWIALYSVIRTSLGTAPESLVSLSQHLYPISFIHTAVPLNSTLAFWNLAVPDSSYLLPFIVGATMYIQQKMITPAPTPGAANSQQAQTAQMMTWMMPLIFGFWSLNVPAGLALYWAVSNASGVVLQYFYMGRTFEWKSLLTLSPATAPAARRNRSEPDKRADGSDSERDIRPAGAAVADEAEIDEDGGPAAVPAGPGTRRKRHGRRRGKR
ncbi:MAG: YidC/Oxa1 family membrane protein insertase [Dehalococcoidia bacterium]